jgi:hypothetical protein
MLMFSRISWIKCFIFLAPIFFDHRIVQYEIKAVETVVAGNVMHGGCTLNLGFYLQFVTSVGSHILCVQSLAGDSLKLGS